MKIIKKEIDMSENEISIITKMKKMIPDFAECWSKMYNMIIESPSFTNYLNGTWSLIYLHLYIFFVSKTQKTDYYGLYLVLMLLNIKLIEHEGLTDEPYIFEYDEYEEGEKKESDIACGYWVLNMEEAIKDAKRRSKYFGTDKFIKITSELYSEAKKEYIGMKRKLKEFEKGFDNKKPIIVNQIVDELRTIYNPFGTVYEKIIKTYKEHIYEDRLLVNSPQELRELAKRVFSTEDDDGETKVVIFKHGTAVVVPVDITIGTTVEATAKRMIVRGSFNDFADSPSIALSDRIGKSCKGDLMWAASQKGGSINYYWSSGSGIDEEIAEMYRKKDAEMLEIDCVI